MGTVKYDLKASKEVIGSLYPRIIDKQGREIDGFHREEADSEWPVTQLEHIDTDVKYWVARIVANTHRRRVEPDERKKEIIELAKALRAEGQEGSLINTIAELTTFSKQHIGNLLKDNPEFKARPGAGGPSGVKLSLTSKQKSKRKSRKQTNVEEKLKNLYNKVEKSVFTGQGSFSQYIDKSEELGLNVESHEIELQKLKACLRDSVGRRYEDVKDSLNEAYNRSVEMKKTLTQQIKAEKARVKKANEELKEKLRNEVKDEVKQEVMGMIEKNHKEKSSEEIAHVGNATGENEWFTPEIYIEAARKLMKTIDVDPASTEIANQIVKASKYYSIKDDGRLQEWDGNVWLNPPYSQPLITEFCNLLIEKFKNGETKQACVLINNATETEFYQNMMKHCEAICFIKGRVKFIDKEGNSTGTPLQGQTILYFGDNTKDFSFIFSEFGVVLHAYQ